MAVRLLLRRYWNTLLKEIGPNTPESCMHSRVSWLGHKSRWTRRLHLPQLRPPVLPLPLGKCCLSHSVLSCLWSFSHTLFLLSSSLPTGWPSHSTPCCVSASLVMCLSDDCLSHSESLSLLFKMLTLPSSYWCFNKGFMWQAQCPRRASRLFHWIYPRQREMNIYPWGTWGLSPKQPKVSLKEL